MTAILSTDILSSSKKIYGKKGDVVKIVADHLNVMIVEDKNGKRFPVSVEKLIK